MALVLDERDLDVDGGERLAVWTLVDTDRAWRGTAVVAPGFGRGMVEMATVAVYLARNGIVVHRYAWLDARGRIRPRADSGFTMTRGLDRLEAVLADLRADHPSLPTAVVAASLSGRLAYRLAARHDGPTAVVTLVGVVHLRDTLRQVLGVDYADWPRELLPSSVEVERVPMDLVPYWDDAHAGDWVTLDGTIAELAAAPGYVANFYSSKDAWVNAAEAERAFRDPGAGRRMLCELEAGQHDLARNPVALQATLSRLSGAVLEGMGVVPADELVVPAFREIVHQLRQERRLQRRRDDAGSTAATEVRSPVSRDEA